LNNESRAYHGIFKSTFLFSFVQVFNIIVKVGLNKAVAIFLGAEGMGTIGLFNNTINLLKTGGGFGISQSAVRDISEAYSSGDDERFSRIITITNKLLILTGLLGFFITAILSSWLSLWSFGNNNYAVAFIVLSAVVGLNIFTEGQLSILKGMRQLRELAKASMIGAFVGLLTSVPLYYFFGLKGIVPSLIVMAVTALFFSHMYVRKIAYVKHKISMHTALKEGSPMIKMGFALMYVSFLGYFADLFISSYISRNGGLELVGFYQAGATIISGYFGIIITAMSTDYYPRISAIHSNNEKLQEEVNRQSEVGMVMALPLIVIFLFLSPVLINILYSNSFLQTINYTDIAILGAVISICSNNMGMILLAKQKSNIFLITVTVQRLLAIIIYIFSYHFYGLTGLGFSYLIMAVIHILLMSAIMNQFFKIRFNAKLIIQLVLILFVSVLTLYARRINYELLKYIVGLILLLISIYYSYFIIKSRMGINILTMFKKI
jgi:O-antigen/teichoic acid export membrane protein